MQPSELIPNDADESVTVESAERYRAFFETSSDALFVEDAAGRILDVNAHACELLGYTRDEFRRMSVADLLPFDTPHDPTDAEALQTQVRFRLETVNRHKDGRLIPVEVVGHRTSLGGQELWLVSVRDISDQKRLKRALAGRSAQLARLNRLSKVLSKSLDGAWIAQTAVNRIRALADLDAAAIAVVDDLRDAPTPIYYSSGISDAFKARFVAHTRTADRLIRQVATLGFPLIIDDVRNDTNLPSRIRRLVAAEGVRTLVLLPIVVGGKVRGVLATAYPRVTEVDEAILHLLEMAVGHVGHALANAWLFRREQQRAAQQQTLVDILSLAIQSMRTEDLLPALAEHAGRLLGADGAFITRWDEVTHATVHVAAYGRYRDLYPSLPPTPADQPTLTQAVLEAERPIGVHDVHHTPLLRRSFAEKFSTRSLLGLPLIAHDRRLGALLIASDTPRRFAQAEIELAQSAAHLVALAIDNARLHDELRQQAHSLSEEVALRTQELRNANEQLRSLDRLKSQLIEQIGHQFRTPVANIGTHLRLLESGRPEKHDHYMAILNDQTEALKRLIETVTAFAEVDLAPDARPFEPWPIANVVDPLATRYRLDAAAKSIQFDVVVGGAELRVRANPQRIGTALNEILSKAFDYTDEGGRVTLAVEHVDEGGRGWVRISVIDTGVGIPADELPRVFDQFFRGRQRLLQVRGVGIGLSLVQAIVQTEGGRVTAESGGVGQGSTFRLWLPAVD